MDIKKIEAKLEELRAGKKATIENVNKLNDLLERAKANASAFQGGIETLEALIVGEKEASNG